jgi:hypothetical protein
MIIDVSTVGIGVILAMPMKKGDLFLIHLTPADSSLVYRVARSRPCSDISHRIGAEFLRRVAGSRAGSLEQDIDRIRKAILA